MAVTKFSIYSPAMGSRRDFPNILLQNAYTPDNGNIQAWDGELRTAKMRKPEMLRNVHTVTSVSGTSIVIPDDYSAVITSGDSIAVYNVMGDYEQVNVVSSTEVSGTTLIETDEAVSDDMLLGQWCMNDSAANTTVSDSSGNGNDAVSARNTALMSDTGKIDKALTFNGTSDKAVCSSELIPATGDFSMCGWIKTSGNLAGDTDKYGCAFGNGGWSGTAMKGIVVRKYAYNNTLAVVMGDGTSSNGYTLLSNYDTDHVDEWHHVVVTYDASENELIIYLDGVQVGTPRIRTYLTSGSDFEIGHQTGLNATESYWYGAIDDVRLYNKVLTTTEVSAIYNAGNGTETIQSNTRYLFKTDDVQSIDPADTNFLKVQTPDNNPIIKYERLVMSDAGNTERLVGFTKAHVYYWNAAETTWELIFTCSGECEYWDSTQYGDYICATNNVDKPIYWDGNSATTCSFIDTQYTDSTSDYITKAKFIKNYRNYLFLGNVSLSDGDTYSHFVFWSALTQGVNEGAFNPNATFGDVASDAGSALIDGDGDITGGFGLWQAYLVIFKRWSVRKMWATLTELTFTQDYLLPAVGCLAPGSVINDNEDKLYFLGSDNFIHELTMGKISYAINDITRNINPELYNKVRSTLINEYNEIWWSIPYGNSSTDNNKVIVFTGDKFFIRDMEIQAFGKYTRQLSYKWDTLPFSTWNSWGWESWDAVDGNLNFIIDLCSDGDGYSYESHGAYTDDGLPYTSYFVLTTDFTNKSGLAYFKRLLRIYLYFRKEASSTVYIAAKRDSENNWQNLGNVALTGDAEIVRKELVCDIRSKHFLFKIYGTDRFSFIGAEFDYLQQGAR